MVSTPSELNTFFQAVLDGRLLTQSSIDEMKNGRLTPARTLDRGRVYGLGLIGTSADLRRYCLGPPMAASLDIRRMTVDRP